MKMSLKLNQPGQIHAMMSTTHPGRRHSAYSARADHISRLLKSHTTNLKLAALGCKLGADVLMLCADFWHDCLIILHAWRLPSI